MVKGRQASLELYTGLVVTLLLLSSAMSGWMVFAAASVLIAVGLLYVPDLRRPGIAAVVVAALTGAVVVLLQRG